MLQMLEGAVRELRVGDPRRLATDEEARTRRNQALGIATAALRQSSAYAAVDELVKSAEAEAKAVSAERDEKETEELKTALGAGGTGKGTAGALRGSAGALRELERRQKSRATRTNRDALDRALIDLAGIYRDALAVALAAEPHAVVGMAVGAGFFIAETMSFAAIAAATDLVQQMLIDEQRLLMQEG